MEGDDDDSAGGRIDEEINLAQEIAERNDDVILEDTTADNPPLDNITDWSNKQINKSL